MRPQSKNVSEGTSVVFECQTPFVHTEVTINFRVTPSRMLVQSSFVLPDGGIEVNVTFLATADANETIVECEVEELAPSGNSDTAEALLLVQGI